jgi:hypothetical protein
VIEGLPIVLVLAAGVGAPVASWYATRRSRSPGIWFALGALTGPIALALLAVAPPGRCPTCDGPTEGWPTTCIRCGTRYRDGEQEYEPDWRRRLPPPRSPYDESPPARTTTLAERGEDVARPLYPVPIATARSRREAGSRETTTWPGRTMVSPMTLGQRPSFTASHFAMATDREELSAVEMLSTGVYISGNAGLEIGACYGISRDGDQLRVIGPVDAGELTIRYEGSISDFDVTAMDDRVIIAGREGRSTLAIVLRSIGGMRAADLEEALTGPVARLRS